MFSGWKLRDAIFLSELGPGKDILLSWTMLDTLNLDWIPVCSVRFLFDIIKPYCWDWYFVNEYMKDHIFELRRKIRISD